MSNRKKIRFYDYVNHPYEKVREALTNHASEIFQDATKVAASRANVIASGLRMNFGPIEVSTEITISINKIEELPAKNKTPRTTVLKFEWKAAKMPRAFPLMKAELRIYRLTATETQLDLSGSYEPPLGPIGEVMNAVIGHRIADASVHRFLSDVAVHLRNVLSK
ncbi:MAG: hypothetical protein O3C43_21385 [Verrucomicrobia bacterium]|nr:hypothetical protein [Verrucomicrobiota bacterium]